MANIDELKNTGLKATLPRLKILDVFQKGAQRHMTAEDVFRVLLVDRSDIGLATVYRVLTQFEQAGILTRSHFESGKAVYELNEGTHHDHLVCLDCGRVEEFGSWSVSTATIRSPAGDIAKSENWWSGIAAAGEKDTAVSASAQIERIITLPISAAMRSTAREMRQ